MELIVGYKAKIAEMSSEDIFQKRDWFKVTLFLLGMHEALNITASSDVSGRIVVKCYSIFFKESFYMLRLLQHVF